MLTLEENELVTFTGPGTPMGDLLRRYWLPVLISWELSEPDCTPVRVKLLGESMVAFRDTQQVELVCWMSSAPIEGLLSGSDATRNADYDACGMVGNTT